jgi:hypothetical protein
VAVLRHQASAPAPPAAAWPCRQLSTAATEHDAGLAGRRRVLLAITVWTCFSGRVPIGLLTTRPVRLLPIHHTEAGQRLAPWAELLAITSVQQVLGPRATPTERLSTMPLPQPSRAPAPSRARCPGGNRAVAILTAGVRRGDACGCSWQRWQPIQGAPCRPHPSTAAGCCRPRWCRRSVTTSASRRSRSSSSRSG